METLNDGRIFPTYKDEVLAWSIGLYFTTQDELEGYPRTKAVIEAFRKYRPVELERERIEMLKSSLSDRLFGHNAKKLLALIES